MKKRLLFIFILIILMPITVMTVMGIYTYKDSKQQKQDRQREEAFNILLSNDRLLRNRLRQIEAELDNLVLNAEISPGNLRSAMNREKLVKQAFILDASNTFLYPAAEGEISDREADFINEAESIDLASILRAGITPAEGNAIPSHWYTWFMGDGINFIYYSVDDNVLKGFLLERYALISALINVLPPSTGKEDSFRILLTDARGDILYQWGDYKMDEPAEPLREYSLKEPLGSWRLFYYYNADHKQNREEELNAFSILPGLALFTLLIILLSLYFYTENTREMKTAQNQVTFVNQVSHELKTPLTNIRLYSELLQNKLTDPGELNHLHIIVEEAGRLGRMINNVLTFSRGERGELKKRIEDVDLNKLICETLNKFRPLLEEKDMTYEFEENLLPPVRTDRDMIEQILVNLMGNAVKYAASGHYIGIQTVLTEESCLIYIRDKGPGIDYSERKRIFNPFYRIDNSLSQNNSGTGIGLTIARKLAEESGSLLKLERSRRGACFSLTIPIKDSKQ